MLRWLATNLRTFLLAFALALVVWVTAVTAANPDETQAYPNPIPIEFIGQDPGLVMTGTVTRQVQVTLRAPQSIWQTLLSGEVPIHAIVDLTGLKAGTRSVEVQIQIAAQPVRIISVTPQKFDLEPRTTGDDNPAGRIEPYRPTGHRLQSRGCCSGPGGKLSSPVRNRWLPRSNISAPTWM